MSYFVSKIGHLDPRFYSLIYCAILGVQMSGVQMSYFVSKIGHLNYRFYSLLYCDAGGPDVGGPDVWGPDVRFPLRTTELLMSNPVKNPASFIG